MLPNRDGATTMNTPFGSLCAPLPAIVLLFMTLLITGCAAREHSRSVEVQIPCGDNLLKNPSFEEGPFQGSRDDPAVMVIKNGSNAVAPWVVDNIVGDQGPRPNFFWVANGNQRGLVASERDHFLLFTRQTSENYRWLSCHLARGSAAHKWELHLDLRHRSAATLTECECKQTGRWRGIGLWPPNGAAVFYRPSC